MERIHMRGLTEVFTIDDLDILERTIWEIVFNNPEPSTVEYAISRLPPELERFSNHVGEVMCDLTHPGLGTQRIESTDDRPPGWQEGDGHCFKRPDEAGPVAGRKLY